MRTVQRLAGPDRDDSIIERFNAMAKPEAPRPEQFATDTEFLEAVRAHVADLLPDRNVHVRRMSGGAVQISVERPDHPVVYVGIRPSDGQMSISTDSRFQP